LEIFADYNKVNCWEAFELPTQECQQQQTKRLNETDGNKTQLLLELKLLMMIETGKKK